MPKTLPAGTVDVAGRTFATNVMPDVFDGRDLEYRPQLHPLPPVKDARPDDHFVLTQEGNSCTGHALAAMINTVLAAGPDPIRVSPYMLYRMARRYDEFEGDEDQGSSLRGALKGWFYHGVLPVEDWPSLEQDVDIDLNPDLARKALRHPLGAFYRVNAFRLDDMQSAINELNAVAASGLIHSGWINPVRVEGADGSSYSRIERTAGVSQLGGHAFSIVGYNEVGFLVQNSWGEDWGSRGFATLTYEDWLTSAYDAWVARPGVPSIVNLYDSTKIVTTNAGVVSQGPGPDLERLRGHVVNLGNDGRLSDMGRFVSTPAQLDRIFELMQESHEQWHEGTGASPGTAPPRRLVLYAHGGLVGEGKALNIAQSQLNWWLNNEVYPITFAWQTGPVETLYDQLADALKDKLPFGGVGFDLVEQADRFVEKIARSRLSWMWAEMKQNAQRASEQLPRDVSWPPDEPTAAEMRRMPGASLVVDRLGAYARSLQDAELEIHLVGHSAGAIFSAHLLNRLTASGLRVASMACLAPAIRLDDFAQLVVPSLQSGAVGRFASFGLTDSLELDDVIGSGRFSIYQKSLLYLVSRALETQRSPGESDVPLLGMQRYLDHDITVPPPGPGAARPLGEALQRLGADLIWSPSEAPGTSRSSATSHGGFDDDASTMTSVLLRILGRSEPDATSTFRPYASLDRRLGVLRRGPRARRREAVQTVDVKPVGDVPVTQTGQSQAAEEVRPGPSPAS